MSLSAPVSDIFDIVDANDRVIGRVTRQEAHAQGLVHRATHVIVHDPAGRIFLQRRSMRKDTFPGCWDSSCSGHVDSGEDYPTAAIRELGEELGWRETVLPLRPLLKLPSSAETGFEFIQIFVLGPISGPFTLHPEEIDEGRWFIPAELTTLIEESPAQVASALRLLWREHRAAILAAIEVQQPPFA